MFLPCIYRYYIPAVVIFKFWGISVTTNGRGNGNTYCMKLEEVEAEVAPDIAWLISELESQKIPAPLSLISMMKKMNWKPTKH